MTKKCFIVMPFGGDDDERRLHYKGVYQSILKPAAEAAGYEVKRADTGSMPGNITKDIINDLATADMVIADLSEGNANVFFELGIRHVLRKSGTVHVVNGESSIPFDVQQYRVVKYSIHLADIPRATAEIAEAIRKREQTSAQSDNPVHDTLPGLPADFREVSEEAQRQEMERLRASLVDARRERDGLADRLAEIDPDGSLSGRPTAYDIDDMLDQAEEIMRSSGEYVMLRLKKIIDELGRDAFVQELRSVVKSPYLSANDFIGLAQMCRSLDLTDHRRVVLEIAHRRLSNNPQIFIALIDAYDDSPAPALQERGRLMLENYLKVDRKDAATGPTLVADLAETGTPLFDNALILLFNFYFRSGHPEWVVSVCESVEASDYQTAVTGRNRARALTELGRTQEAEKVFLETIERYDDSVTHQWFGDFLNKQQRHREAYQQSELGVICAPTSSTAYLNLAIDILNHQLARGPDHEVMSVDSDAATRLAMPVLLKVVELGDLADRQNVVSLLVRQDAMQEAQEIAQGRVPQGSYDYSVLKYLAARATERQAAA